MAGVFANGSKLPHTDILADVIPVLIAETVRWEVEFRCFVLDRQVIDISPYLRFGELARTPEGEWFDERTEAAKIYATSAMADDSFAIPPAVVMDVGVIEGRGWAIVEANAAWGSGIYGCDPANLLKVIRRACVPINRITDADRPWIIARNDQSVNQ